MCGCVKPPKWGSRTVSLNHFKVIGLHGRRTIDVPLQDNKLILVGENGTSKSTFVNLIYFVLTLQWERLREYRFVAIQATLGDVEVDITPEKLEEYRTHRHHWSFLLRRNVPTMWRPRLRRVLEEHPEEMLSDEASIYRVSEELGIPPRRLRELVLQYSREASGPPPALQGIGKQISALGLGQFLYLPTYRRIEQDLKSIFRDADIEADLKNYRSKLAAPADSQFVELVQFGMEDVERTIVARMGQIKENVRKGLDNLTGTYLRDVIRGVHSTVDVTNVRSIDPATLESMFARIDDATLPVQDKERLKEKVKDMAGRQQIEPQDRVIAHFLTKLIELYTEQQSNEKDVREFVRVCNEYLVGKQIVFDNTKYNIFIRLSPDVGEQFDLDEKPLELKSLSSGEKQIVSLFSHIYLSGQKSFFVVIDEPELSLSVPWQRRFLPDILKSQMCTGLVSVTHSPFIWENELETYVRSISEFTVPHHVVR